MWSIDTFAILPQKNALMQYSLEQNLKSFQIKSEQSIQ